MSLRDDYRRDGFVVLPSAVIDNVPGSPIFIDTIKSVLCREFERSPTVYRAKARLMSQLDTVSRMFHAPKILDAIKQLGVSMPTINALPAGHVMGVDPNWDGVAAHQDWPSLQSSLNAVTVWAPFHDVSLDNFPLEIVRGSHLMGLLPAVASEHYSTVDTDGMEFTPVPMRRGDVILFSAFTVHRTRTPGKGIRIAFSMRYEDGRDQWFEDHNYYSAQSRVIDREVRHVPTIEQVREVFK